MRPYILGLVVMGGISEIYASTYNPFDSKTFSSIMYRPTCTGHHIEEST